MTDQEQKNIFANNLNNLLHKYSKTQREVAEKIGVSPQTFNTWCQAIALPRMGKVQRLADYFNIPKSKLIDDVSENSNASSISTTLTPDETALLNDYKRLNSTGKEKVREYASDLTEQRKYREDSASYRLMNTA